ncbi:hypothetical protein ACFQHO_27565 [Actinomadura yumaensis]|uniref:hypothetical protein n=1 Tax=Actinomadura yumaensis TaxID=111807 RepID=UPI00361AE421
MVLGEACGLLEDREGGRGVAAFQMGAEKVQEWSEACARRQCAGTVGRRRDPVERVTGRQQVVKALFRTGDQVSDVLGPGLGAVDFQRLAGGLDADPAIPFLAAEECQFRRGGGEQCGGGPRDVVARHSAFESGSRGVRALLEEGE